MKKTYIAIKIIFSIIFALILTLDSMLVFPGTIFNNIDTIYFSSLGIKNILIFIFASIGTFLLITLLEYISNKLEKTIYTKNERNEKNIKVYFIIFAVILLCWLPTILSYFPGGIYADTTTSINQAVVSNKITNHNPALYTLILRMFLVIGSKIGSYEIGLKLFTIFQTIAMASIISYLIYWLYKRKISIKYIVMLTIIFGIFRLIPMYAISIWKDTPFCLALFAYTIFILETVYQNGKNLETKWNGIILNPILILSVSFLRNNGIYVVIATTIILFIVYKKKLFAISSTITIIATLIIQGPIYNYYEMNTATVESLGVPIQQLCYVVAKEDGNLNEEQKEFINNICNIDIIKQQYNPCLVDTIKWNPNFNNNFLSEHKSEFMKTWLKVFTQNPLSYVKAYLLNTLGFWDVNKATMDAYINPQMWGDDKETININENESVKQTDYIKNVTGHSIRNIVTPNKPISSAVFLFINLFCAIITIYRKQYKNLLIFLPAILTWGTIMVAAPLAFSLRYVYILVMTTPISLLVPFIKQNDIIENKEKEVK